jgi:hypothetical protein
MCNEDLIALNAVNVKVSSAPFPSELERATGLKARAGDPSALVLCVIVTITRAPSLVCAYALSVRVFMTYRFL